MTTTTVHVVRHGEVHNPGRVLYGRMPGFRLSDAGRTMAAAAARVLAGRDVRLVVSSPLERAMETARPIAASYGLEVTTDERLVEARNVFEGRPVDGVRSFLDAEALRHVWNPFRPSWGEPYAEIARRTIAAVTAARDAVTGHEAVCVTHQLPIVVLRRAVERRPLWHRPDRRLCGLASITSFTWYGDRLGRVTYCEPAGDAARKAVTPGA
jgi:broad specificity phosphatase PhoE